MRTFINWTLNEENDFMRDNLHFPQPKSNVSPINEQDQYDRLVNATPEQKARLRELDRKQQARESDPITGKYSTALRTGGLDAAIGALEDDGRQARVGQMRTDIASGELKPRAATQAATQAAAPATPPATPPATQTNNLGPLAPNPPAGTGTVLRDPEEPVGTGTVLRDPSQVEMPDSLQNIGSPMEKDPSGGLRPVQQPQTSPNVGQSVQDFFDNFGKPMVKNPAGGMMPDPKLAQSPNVGQSGQDFFDNLGKPMVKNPAGGMMPDPKFGQSNIDDAPEEEISDVDRHAQGYAQGVDDANRNYDGGVTIAKAGRQTIGSVRGQVGSTATLASRGVGTNLLRPLKATKSSSSSAQAGRPPSAASMMNRQSGQSQAIASALKNRLAGKFA